MSRSFASMHNEYLTPPPEPTPAACGRCDNWQPKSQLCIVYHRITDPEDGLSCVYFTNPEHEDCS